MSDGKGRNRYVLDVVEQDGELCSTARATAVSAKEPTARSEHRRSIAGRDRNCYVSELVKQNLELCSTARATIASAKETIARSKQRRAIAPRSLAR